jgi:hypothetical protein
MGSQHRKREIVVAGNIVPEQWRRPLYQRTGCCPFRKIFRLDRSEEPILPHTGAIPPEVCLAVGRISAAVKNVISMDSHLNKGASRSLLVRDRRYAIRHPFAADADFIDLEAGSSGNGVTSDLSMGGCFVCTSKPLLLNTRLKLKLTRKDHVIEALAVVRIVKPRIGMGIEFLDLDEKYQATLERWLLELKCDR